MHNHSGEILLVDEPGKYCLEVITGDRVCTYMYCTVIEAPLSAVIFCQQHSCGEDKGELHIEISGGIPPFNTIISSTQGFYQEYFHSNDLVVNELPNGNYSISVTDNLGNVKNDSCTIETTSYASFNAIDIPNATLSSTNTSILLDTQQSTNAFGSYTYYYQWYLDNEMLPYTSPELLVAEPGEYKVEISVLELGCVGVILTPINYEPSCKIETIVYCEQYNNILDIEVIYGFAPFETIVYGIEASGASYHEIIHHSDSVQIADIPYGSFTVETYDKYGKSCVQQVIFEEVLKENINLEDILMDACNGTAFCSLNTPHGDYTQYFCSLSNCMNIFKHNNNTSILLDASINLSNPNAYSFEWFEDGISLGIYDAQVVLSQWYDLAIPIPMDDALVEYTVVATHAMGCSIESSFLAADNFTIVPYIPATVPTAIDASGYDTRVYPNPSTTTAMLYYDIENKGTDVFNANVELISMTGAILERRYIQGKSFYTLTFELLTTGTYLIRTTTKEGEILLDRVIIK